MFHVTDLLRSASLGMVFAILANMSINAQDIKTKTQVDADRVEQVVNQTIAGYESCLRDAYFANAKIYANKAKITNSALANCIGQRKAVHSALSTFMEPPPKLKAVLKNIESSIITKVDNEYKEETTMRLSMMATILAAKELCQNANKNEMDSLYNFIADALARDFAFFRQKGTMNNYAKKYRIYIQEYINRDGNAKWCENKKKTFDELISRKFFSN